MRQSCVVFILLNLSEIMIYAVLSLFKWNFVCGINENFFSILILQFNIAIVLIIQIPRWLMGGMENPLFELISGRSNLNVVHGEFNFWKIFISLIGIILMITGILIGYKSSKISNLQLPNKLLYNLLSEIRNAYHFQILDSKFHFLLGLKITILQPKTIHYWIIFRLLLFLVFGLLLRLSSFYSMELIKPVMFHYKDK